MLDGNEVSCLTIMDFHSFHACASFLDGANLLVTPFLCFCQSHYHTVCSPFYCCLSSLFFKSLGFCDALFQSQGYN